MREPGRPAFERRPWTGQGLDEGDVAGDPMDQFARWYAEAEEAGQPEPEALALATATPDGVPSLRWVLLKGFDRRGVVFYTNQHSRKGRELAANPTAAVGWRWLVLERQVRLSGPVEEVTEAEADAYFTSRPRGSQISAWASEQSEVIARRSQLEARVAELEERFAGVEVPRPAWWGGYRVRPEVVEFWQGRPDRLHDRVRYRLAGGPGSGWVVERLAP